VVVCVASSSCLIVFKAQCWQEGSLVPAWQLGSQERVLQLSGSQIALAPKSCAYLKRGIKRVASSYNALTVL
jgi:hypothetical protein